MEEVPKISESVEATVPQSFEDEVFVIASTSTQGANLQDTVLNVGETTTENVPEKAPPVDSGKGRKRKP